jgi:hypothetical protein
MRPTTKIVASTRRELGSPDPPAHHRERRLSHPHGAPVAILTRPNGIGISLWLGVLMWHVRPVFIVDDVVNIQSDQSYGIGSVLVKRDLEDAFRHIPVSPLDWPWLGSHWDSTYHADCF